MWGLAWSWDDIKSLYSKSWSDDRQTAGNFKSSVWSKERQHLISKKSTSQKCSNGISTRCSCTEKVFASVVIICRNLKRTKSNLVRNNHLLLQDTKFKKWRNLFVLELNLNLGFVIKVLRYIELSDELFKFTTRNS